MNKVISKVLLIVLLYFAFIPAQINKNNALSTAEKIADRIIHDTSFELKNVTQHPAVDVQVIDFKKALPGYKGKGAYIFVLIKCNKSTKLNFGLSFSQPFSLYSNNKQVYTNKLDVKFHFREIAYSIFSFNDTVSLKLRKGINRIYIKFNSNIPGFIFLREITNPDKPVQTSFLPVNKEYKNYTWPWCFVEGENLSADLINEIFSDKNNAELNIVYSKQNIEKKLEPVPGTVFKKDSYADWNYANGETMMSLCTLSEVSGKDKYLKFVKKYCDFMIEHLPLFRKQYFVDHDLRTTGYRIFRKSMLDDAGAAILPYIDLDLIHHSNFNDKSNTYDSLIKIMANYVMRDQYRLSDGTFCRPEPKRWTIWSDDLFMSVPLLVRMRKLTHQDKYYNEAIKQILNFNKYLFVHGINLYKHGWFSWNGKRSAVYWGRANGWVAWAVSEALLNIPRDFAGYNKIKKLFLEHLHGLIKIQDKDGMWHQVLNDKSSYEETSCTAMFVLAISRAIRIGWLDKKYSINVERAWKALQRNINSEGIVKRICGGTGVGFSKEFYKTRKTYKNDPRGLGAVITAAVEVHKLSERGH